MKKVEGNACPAIVFSEDGDESCMGQVFCEDTIAR